MKTKKIIQISLLSVMLVSSVFFSRCGTGYGPTINAQTQSAKV